MGREGAWEKENLLSGTPKSAFIILGHKVAPFGLSSPITIRNGVERREYRQNTPPTKNNLKTHPIIFKVWDKEPSGRNCFNCKSSAQPRERPAGRSQSSPFKRAEYSIGILETWNLETESKRKPEGKPWTPPDNCFRGVSGERGGIQGPRGGPLGWRVPEGPGEFEERGKEGTRPSPWAAGHGHRGAESPGHWLQVALLGHFCAHLRRARGAPGGRGSSLLRGIWPVLHLGQVSALSCSTRGWAADAPSRAGRVGGVALGQARLPGDREGPRGTERCAFVRGARLPSSAAGARTGGGPPRSGDNFFPASLSVTKGCARECEDAVDLLRFCQHVSLAAETSVRKACLGEAELSGTSNVRRGLFKVPRLLLKTAVLLNASPLFLTV